MRILEVREGLVKFESENSVKLASLWQIEDFQKNYIVQAIQVKKSVQSVIVYAKIINLYNGEFLKYDKTLPSLEAEIKPISADVFNSANKLTSPVLVGVNGDDKIYLEQVSFNKKLLCCIDNVASYAQIIENLSEQFSKSVVIDMTGNYSSSADIAGLNFKLPLNTESLTFLYQDCLSDATSDSKSLVKEIFQDLSEYSLSVPFLPFNALKTIVDDMVDKSHVFKLLVLKNKLAKFSKLGYFAQNEKESEALNEILTRQRVVINLSKLDMLFQNRYLEVVLSAIEKLNPDAQVFIIASNSINKANIKKLLTGNLRSVFITHSRFKYINEIKSFFTEYLIEPSFAAGTLFKEFSILLSALNKDSYLVAGEDTLGVPFVANIGDFSANLIKVNEDTEVCEPEQILEEISQEPIEEFADNLGMSEADKASVKVINQKSDDLINKIAEEINADSSSSGINIFDEQEELLNEDAISDSIIQADDVEIEQETMLESDSADNITLQAEETTETNLEIEAETDSNDENYEEQEVVSDNIEEAIIEDTELTEEDLEVSNNQIDEEDVNITEYPTIVDNIKADDILDPVSEDDENLEENITLCEEDTDEHIENSDEASEYIVSIDKNEEKFLEEELISDEQPEYEQISVESDMDEYDEIIELDESEVSDDDIIVDFSDENETVDEEALNKEIVEDVDKVFTTIKDNSISDEDLDFIDALNETVEQDDEVVLSEGMEELTDFNDNESDEGFVEPLEEVNSIDMSDEEDKEVLETREASTPIVPVYGAEIPSEDLVVSDPIEQGDSVVHAKYGNGVVEKMIKYGNKTLYSINFDNVGRRLLDPTLTEIKKA